MTSHLATELYVSFASSLILLIRSPNSYFCFSSKLQQTNGMLWATSVLFAKSRILHNQNLHLDGFSLTSVPSWTHSPCSWPSHWAFVLTAPYLYRLHMLLHVPSFLHLYENGALPSELAESLGLGKILLEIHFFQYLFWGIGFVLVGVCTVCLP